MDYRKLFGPLLIVATLSSLIGCVDDGSNNEPIFLHFDFSEDSQGVSIDTANHLGNYRPDGPNANFISAINDMPEPFSYRKGIRFQWNNELGQVKGFVKTPIFDLKEKGEYVSEIEVGLVTNTPEYCDALGTMPGIDVSVSVGVWDKEPVKVVYYVYTDTGPTEPEVKGMYDEDALESMYPLGSIGLPYDCPRDTSQSLNWETKVLVNHDVRFTASEEGVAWLYISFDSTHIGHTEFFITDIDVALYPSN